MLIQKYGKSESLTRRWLDFWLFSYLPQVSTTTILKARVRRSLTRRTRQYSRWPASSSATFSREKIRECSKAVWPTGGYIEATHVHDAARRCGCVAARGARTAGWDAAHRRAQPVRRKCSGGGQSQG